jgi:hypothetical protein
LTLKPQRADPGNQLPLGSPGPKKPWSQKEGGDKSTEKERKKKEKIHPNPFGRKKEDGNLRKVEGEGKGLAKELKVRKIDPEKEGKEPQNQKTEKPPKAHRKKASRSLSAVFKRCSGITRISAIVVM